MNYFINPVSLECHIKILDEMRKYICSIGINKEIITFGFFCKFPFPDNEHMLSVLISNSQKINNEILAKEKEIFILINDEGNSPKYVNLEVLHASLNDTDEAKPWHDTCLVAHKEGITQEDAKELESRVNNLEGKLDSILEVINKK